MVELLVTLTVLAIAVGAVSQMFVASLRTGSAAALRTDAMSLAARDIEAMRAIPYQQLGFNATQPGYSSTFNDGATTYHGPSQWTPALPGPPDCVAR
jgi:Tfp pilus assembly protein PilV